MTSSNIRLFRTLAAFGLIAALLGGFFIPVYTDEIGWRFQERAGFDGVDKMFNDICGPNTLAAPPFFMMPVRYFSSTLNSLFADPFWVRVSGVLYALLLVALLTRLVHRFTRDAHDRIVFNAFAYAMLGLGVLPFLMVWSRPEQPVLLCLLSALLLAVPGEPVSSPSGDRRAQVLRLIAIVALWVIAVSYHLKALMLFPVFACCIFFVTQGANARWPRTIAAVIFVAATAASAHYWIDRLACPGSPALTAAYARHNVGSEIFSVTSPGEAWETVKILLGNLTFSNYVALAVPPDYPLSDWLVGEQVGKSAGYSIFAVLLMVWAIACLAGLWALVTGLADARRTRSLDRKLVLAVACVISLMGWSSIQKWNNVYEAPFVMIIMVLALLMAFSGANIAPKFRIWLERFTAAVALLALANPFMLAAIWGPSLAESSRQGGYLEKQKTSVSVFGYSQVRRDIMAVARKCGIPEPKQAQGVLLDEATYFAYMDSKLPQHRLGAFGLWRGEIDDPIAYLKTRNSDGMIIGCHHLDDNLRARARRSGSICCLAPPEW